MWFRWKAIWLLLQGPDEWRRRLWLHIRSSTKSKVGRDGPGNAARFSSLLLINRMRGNRWFCDATAEEHELDARCVLAEVPVTAPSIPRCWDSGMFVSESAALGGGRGNPPLTVRRKMLRTEGTNPDERCQSL